MEPLRIGGFTVYPFGGLMALCAVAAFMCIAFSMKKKGLSRGTASWFAVLSVPLCFIFARLLYCLSMLDQIIGYDDYGMVFRFSEGGFMLWGAIVGGIIAAILTARITRQSAWTILDSSVVSACLLIAAGRLICGLSMKDVGTGMGLSDWFNTEWVDDPEMNRFSLFALEDYRFFERLPFAVKNFYDEWCWAVFVPECLWALITAVCVYRYKAEHGGKTLLFITMYSCGQILLESMLHGEVVYLPWLGFVKCNTGQVERKDGCTVFSGCDDYRCYGVRRDRKKDFSDPIMACGRMSPDYGGSLYMAWHNGFQAYSGTQKNF